MNIKDGAKITLKEIDREINSSKVLELLQDAYNTIEELIGEVSGLEKTVEENEKEIKSLNRTIDDLENNL